MRQLQRFERGSAHWPFIIALLLLFAFVYMWFDERDQREQAELAVKTAEAGEKKANAVTTDFVNYARDLTGLVGWDSKLATDVVQDAANKDLASRLAGPDTYFTDLDKLRVHLLPEGTKENGEPGLLNYLINQAQIQIRADLRSKAAEGVTETQIDFSWMSPELKRKLQEVAQMKVPMPPAPVIDPDDEADVARFESEKRAYDEAVARWQQAMNELQEIEGFRRVQETVLGPGGWDPDTQRVVLLEMFTQDLTGVTNVQDLVTFPPKIIENFKGEFKANKDEDVSVIERLRAETAAKSTEIDDLQNQLRDEQQRHTADVEQLRTELAQANENAERNRQDATTALSELGREKEDKQQAVAQADARISALENRIRTDKEKRDLEIRRDDPDGSILSSSPLMRTAIIDLGSRAKVFPGLKFNVSRIGRGGIRQIVGQVMVTRVLGDSSAKVAILSESDPRNPVVQGDLISNPFYKPGEEIHVWFAGDLERYPIEVATSRLAQMNVIVDKEVDGDTDYVVIPDSMSAPAPAGGEGDEEEEEAAPGAQTEIDRVLALARQYGATVITERMLNTFLGL